MEEKARSDNRGVQLFLRKCCIVGNFGVLWGRKIMESHKATHVYVYRQHREIHRQQAAFVNTNRDAGRFCDGVRSERGVCFPRISGEHLSLVGFDFRSNVKISRPFLITQRGCDGIRATALFTIETYRDRQSRADSSSGITAGICRDRKPSNCDWRAGSHRNQRSERMESYFEREIAKVAQNPISSTQSRFCSIGGNQ